MSNFACRVSTVLFVLLAVSIGSMPLWSTSEEPLSTLSFVAECLVFPLFCIVLLVSFYPTVACSWPVKIVAWILFIIGCFTATSVYCGSKMENANFNFFAWAMSVYFILRGTDFWDKGAKDGTKILITAADFIGLILPHLVRVFAGMALIILYSLLACYLRHGYLMGAFLLLCVLGGPSIYFLLRNTLFTRVLSKVWGKMVAASPKRVSERIVSKQAARSVGSEEVILCGLALLLFITLCVRITICLTEYFPFWAAIPFAAPLGIGITAVVLLSAGSKLLEMSFAALIALLLLYVVWPVVSMSFQQAKQDALRHHQKRTPTPTTRVSQ